MKCIHLTYHYNIEYLNTQSGLKTHGLNTYTKSEVDNIINPLDIPPMLSTINDNGTNIVDILNTRYTKTEVDTLISSPYTKNKS